MLIALLLAAPAWTIRGLPVGLADVAIAATVVAFIVQRQAIRPTAVLVTAVLWGAALVLSLRSAPHLDNALHIVRIGEGLALLLLLPLNLNLTFDDVKWWLLGGGAFGLIVGLLLFARNLGHIVPGRPQYIYFGHYTIPRATGYFNDAAQFGTFAALEIVVGVMVLLGPGTRRDHVIAAGAIGLGGLALVASYSRTSLVFLAVAGTIAVALLLGWRRYALPAAAVAAIALVGLVLIERRSFTADLSTGRLGHWPVIFSNFLDQGPPTWLTGVGYKVVANDPNSVMLRGIQGDHRFVSIDNTYLSSLVETGVIGLATMVAWIAAMVREIVRAGRGRLQTLTLALFVGLLAEGLTVDSLTYYRLIGLIALLVAVAEGV